MIDMSDYARNGADVYFVKDTTDFVIPDSRKLTQFDCWLSPLRYALSIWLVLKS